MNNPNNQTTHATDIFESYIKQLNDFKQCFNNISVSFNKNELLVDFFDKNTQERIIKLFEILNKKTKKSFESLEKLNPSFNLELQNKLKNNLEKLLINKDTTINDAIINLKNELSYFEFLDANLINNDYDNENIKEFQKIKGSYSYMISYYIKSLNQFNDEQKKTKKIHEILNDDKMLFFEQIHLNHDMKKKIHNIAASLFNELIFENIVIYNNAIKFCNIDMLQNFFSETNSQKIEMKNFVKTFLENHDNNFEKSIKKIEKIIESIKKGDLLELQNIRYEPEFSSIEDCLEHLQSCLYESISEENKKYEKKVQELEKSVATYNSMLQFLDKSLKKTENDEVKKIFLDSKESIKKIIDNILKQKHELQLELDKKFQDIIKSFESLRVAQKSDDQELKDTINSFESLRVAQKSDDQELEDIINNFDSLYFDDYIEKLSDLKKCFINIKEQLEHVYLVNQPNTDQKTAIKELIKKREKCFESIEKLNLNFTYDLKNKLRTNLKKLMINENTIVDSAIISLKNELKYFEFLDEYLIHGYFNNDIIKINSDDKKFCDKKDKFKEIRGSFPYIISSYIKELNNLDSKDKTKKISEVKNINTHPGMHFFKDIHLDNNMKNNLHNVVIELFPEFVIGHVSSYNKSMENNLKMITENNMNKIAYIAAKSDINNCCDSFTEFVNKIQTTLKLINKSLPPIQLQNPHDEQGYLRIEDCLKNLKSCLSKKEIDDSKKKSDKPTSVVSMPNVDCITQDQKQKPCI